MIGTAETGISFHAHSFLLVSKAFSGIGRKSQFLLSSHRVSG